MRCLVCEKYSFFAICKQCQESFLIIKPKIRIIEDLKIYSVYNYEDISFLLNLKYYAMGSRVIKILSKKASKHFEKTHGEFFKQHKVYGVGIDDNPKKGYSHTGVILRVFSSLIKPIYGELIAKKSIKYAGKNLAYRQQNPKDFTYYSGAKDVVIIDDIVTTGSSMLQAKRCIEKAGGNVLFGIVLSDAKK